MADTEKTKVAEGAKVALPDISPMIAAPQEGEQLGEGQKLAQQVKNGEQRGTAPVAKPQDSVQPAGDASGRGGYVPGSFYTDFFAKNNPYKKRVEDAEEQMERMRRNKLFASIGSGFDAFHQAYANMRGVKPMESPKVADKYIAQYNALKKYRDANQDAFTNAYMEAMKRDAAEKLNADMMKFREKQAEETKRHNDAMESIYADRITAGQQKADKDRASREDIAEKNREAQNQRNAASNAAKVTTANIRHSGSGGKNDEYEKKIDKTYTKTDEWGNKVNVHEQKTETKKKGSGSSGGTGGSDGSKGSDNYNKYKVNSNKGGNNYSQYKTK